MNLKTINPFTNKEIHTYSLHSNKQIDSIIKDVYKSYNDWKNTSFKDRKRLLVEIALHLKQNSFEYAGIITKSMGLLADGWHMGTHAAALGITSLERHITLDRAMYGSDQAASVEPSGFRMLVGAVHKIEQAMGDGEKRILETEISIAQKLRDHLKWEASE